jgi:hypothetical protein
MSSAAATTSATATPTNAMFQGRSLGDAGGAAVDGAAGDMTGKKMSVVPLRPTSTAETPPSGTMTVAWY